MFHSSLIFYLNGENVSNLILEKCEQLGLDMSNLFKLGYDDAGYMSGQINVPKVMYITRLKIINSISFVNLICKK